MLGVRRAGSGRDQESARGPDAQEGEQEGAEQVHESDHGGPAQAALHDVRHDLGGIGREGGQAAHETGDHEQAPFWSQAGFRAEYDDRDADQVAADQVRSEGAERELGEDEVHAQAQGPAKQGAQAGADEDRDEGEEQGGSWAGVTGIRGGAALSVTVGAGRGCGNSGARGPRVDDSD